MEHLDISRVLAALRDRPGEFSLTGGKLHHRPSHQTFSIGTDRRIMVESTEEREMLLVEPEQSSEFANLFGVWKEEYWIPLEVKRHFPHGPRPRAGIMICLRQFLLLHLQSHRDSAVIIYGNCWAGLRSE